MAISGSYRVERVEINGRVVSLVLNHRAVVRGGEISNNDPTHLLISFNSNHGHLYTNGSNGSTTHVNNLSPKPRRDHLFNGVSGRNSSNNTISNVNKSITQRPNVTWWVI